jgi:hypothetical protein
MEQLITHACGHEQAHYLTGYASQQERKARWLQTTHCRSCFIAGKKAKQAEAALRDDAAIAHLKLPVLVGSDRQVGWATTIRASRLAGLLANPESGTGWQTCLTSTDAKWWIDHREAADGDLLASIRENAKVSLISHEVHQAA